MVSHELCCDWRSIDSMRSSAYAKDLLFPIVEEWDRSNGRGSRPDIGGGLRLEILDNARERQPLLLHPTGDRFHVVVEVADIEAVRRRLTIVLPPTIAVSWAHDYSSFVIRTVFQ